MTRTEIFLKLKDLIRGVYPQVADRLECVSEQSLLVHELGMDSMGLLCTIIAIEEDFGVDFEGTSLKDFATVGAVIDYIQNKLELRE